METTKDWKPKDWVPTKTLLKRDQFYYRLVVFVDKTCLVAFNGPGAVIKSTDSGETFYIPSYDFQDYIRVPNKPELVTEYTDKLLGNRLLALERNKFAVEDIEGILDEFADRIYEAIK